MTVSVIIPSYNHSKYLRQRIDSVLGQTFKDFELIILDDASTDNSREILMEYKTNFPSIITCFDERNSGIPAIQWNKGVELAKGEYIWIAESDDYAEKTFLEKTLAEIKKSDRNGMVFCDTRIQNQERDIEYLNSAKKEWLGFNVKKLAIEELIENPIPNVSSVLFRKDSYIGSGMADMNMRFCADWLLYLKIKQKWDILYLPEVLNTYRLHEGSGYHLQYQNNKYLYEKVRVYSLFFQKSSLKVSILLKMSFNMVKTFGLRLMHMAHLPSVIIPGFPRTPKKEYLHLLNPSTEP